MFFNWMLAIAASVLAIKAMDEIRAKQREEYNRVAMPLSDTLHFEPDT